MEKKHYILIFIALLIGVAIGLVLFAYLFGLSEKTLNIIKAGSIIFVGISVLIGIYQLSANVRQIRYSNDWNKKQLATIRIHESDKTLKESISILHPTLAVVERNPDDPYEIYEIHNQMGVFLKDETFVFHGEQTDDDIKKLPEDDKQREKHINQFKKKFKGRKVRDNIVALLNEYEYISLNVNCGIFDKETVMRLFEIKLLRTFLKFKKYIIHLREDHKYGQTVYIEFEKFAKEIKKVHDKR